MTRPALHVLPQAAGEDPLAGPPAIAVDFGGGRRPRRPSLTPLVDVVFLLLVFFMLAARFGLDTAVPVAAAGLGAAADWQGPPRLVTVAGDAVALNGRAIAPEALAPALSALMPSPDAPVVLKSAPGTTLQQLLAVTDRLDAAGIATLTLAP